LTASTRRLRATRSQRPSSPTATGYTVTVYGPHRVGEVDTVRIDATPAGSVFSGAGGIHVADAHASGDYSNFRSDVTDLAGYSYTVTPTVAAAHVLTSINDETLTDPSGQTVTVVAASINTSGGNRRNCMVVIRTPRRAKRRRK
jgi:hypothetical protein